MSSQKVFCIEKKMHSTCHICSFVLCIIVSKQQTTTAPNSRDGANLKMLFEGNSTSTWLQDLTKKVIEWLLIEQF